MISNELLSEIIKVSNKNQYIDKRLLLQVATNAIENSNPITKSKFQEIIYTNDKFSSFQAKCYEDLGLIYVYYDQIISDIKRYNKISYLTANLLIIQVLLHEI